MEISVRSRTDVTAFTAHLKEVVDRHHLGVRQSSLNEATARGFGKNTFAALLAAVSTQQLNGFDSSAFLSRLKDFVEIPGTVEAVDTLLNGLELDIQVVKLPPERQQSGGHIDTIYFVSVQVCGSVSEGVPGGPTTKIILPEFATAGGEPYRVDSATTYRQGDSYAITRERKGRQVVTAVLREGQWEGKLFIYSPRHQIDDTNCIQSVKAALARSILPVISQRVCCLIFRPDHYQVGAWRIELSLSPKVRAFLGGSNLRFAIPRLRSRQVDFLSPYRVDVGYAKFVDGVWCADLYSNGVQEHENPTTIEQFKTQLLSNVNSSLERAGFDISMSKQ